MMGSDDYDNEKPTHNVKIDQPFFMGKTEVTQKQWQTIMGNNPSAFKDENRPVEQVSWYDVQEFLKRLNEKESTKKYRLPTEAEWEYAARANSTNKWHFGNNENELKNYAWYWDNSGKETHEVGQKKPNRFGLYDMYGNVWEWTCSEYKNYNENKELTCSNNNNANRTARGGSWKGNSKFVRSANRDANSLGGRLNKLGFRLARTF